MFDCPAGRFHRLWRFSREIGSACGQWRQSEARSVFDYRRMRRIQIVDTELLVIEAALRVIEAIRTRSDLAEIIGRQWANCKIFNCRIRACTSTQ